MTIRTALVLVATAIVTALLGTSPATASSGEEFADHVRSCRQSMGFDGTHNPGMHQGFSGWHPDHAC